MWPSLLGAKKQRMGGGASVATKGTNGSRGKSPNPGRSAGGRIARPTKAGTAKSPSPDSIVWRVYIHTAMEALRKAMGPEGIGCRAKVVIHEAEEGGYWAEVPALPGCYTQAESLEELRANLRDAISGYLMCIPGGFQSVEEGGTVEELDL
jgi:predicted RNase H-like HicB family nuclease